MIKKITRIATLLLAVACGQKNNSGTYPGNIAAEGGVQFTKSASFCQGGAFSVQEGQTMSWSRVALLFGGMSQLSDTLAEEVTPRRDYNGAIVLTQNGNTYTGATLGQDAYDKAGQAQPVLSNSSGSYDYSDDDYLYDDPWYE